MLTIIVPQHIGDKSRLELNSVRHTDSGLQTAIDLTTHSLGIFALMNAVDTNALLTYPQVSGPCYWRAGQGYSNTQPKVDDVAWDLHGTTPEPAAGCR